MGWATTFEEAQLSQIASNRPILVFVWQRYDSDVKRFERGMMGWKGMRQILESYCKVYLQADENREFLQSLGVTVAPCLVLIGTDPLAKVEDRVIGILEDVRERESVVSFLQRGLLEATLGEGEGTPRKAFRVVRSVTDLVEAAAEADRDDEPLQAIQLLAEAAQHVTSSTGEASRNLFEKLADLCYEIGDLEKALKYYRLASEALVGSETEEKALLVLYRLALLLNDVGDNEAAAEIMEKRIALEKDPESKKRLQELREAIEAGLFVLADMGYPGVGERLFGGGGAKAKVASGTENLSFEDRLNKAKNDLDRLQTLLGEHFRNTGRYPDYLEDLIGLESTEEKLPTDPFLESSNYHYLHFENPEDYSLYSVGPDGMDDWGDLGFDPKEGERGKGDIVRKSGTPPKE